MQKCNFRQMLFMWLIVALVSGIWSADHTMNGQDDVTGISAADHPVNGQNGAKSWVVEDYPNPRYRPSLCGRTSPSFLCDPDKVLSDSQADFLSDLLQSVCQQTVCVCQSGCLPRCGGYSIAVALVRNMSSPNSIIPVGSADFDHWAVHLREIEWSYGSCQDDTVIVASQDNTRIHTETGAKTKEVLSDDCIDKIYNLTRKNVTDNNLYESLDYIIQLYFESLQIGRCAADAPVIPYDPLTRGIIALIVAGCVALPMTVAACCCYWCRVGCREGWCCNCCCCPAVDDEDEKDKQVMSPGNSAYSYTAWIESRRSIRPTYMESSHRYKSGYTSDSDSCRANLNKHSGDGGLVVFY